MLGITRYDSPQSLRLEGREGRREGELMYTRERAPPDAHHGNVRIVKKGLEGRQQVFHRPKHNRRPAPVPPVSPAQHSAHTSTKISSLHCLLSYMHPGPQNQSPASWGSGQCVIACGITASSRAAAASRLYSKRSPYSLRLDLQHFPWEAGREMSGSGVEYMGMGWVEGM